jgi:hypothetical protein
VTVATGRQTPIWPRRLSRPPHDWTSSKYQHQLTDYGGEGIIIRVADSGLLSEPDRGGSLSPAVVVGAAFLAEAGLSIGPWSGRTG